MRASFIPKFASSQVYPWLTVFLLLGLLGSSRAANDWAAVRSGTTVLFRHANAPGTGDPAGFNLSDCRTQRNLDETGRAQARRIGESFRTRGIVVRKVLTSQWCRTRDTANLAFPGLVQDAPEFNSFFADVASQDKQTRAALETLRAWTGPGVLVVVTHQVNITALTGIVPASGEGIVVRGGVKPDAPLEVLGRIVP